jgi:hypothetical protein
VDNTFFGGSSADGTVNSVLIQSNGKILVAGSFTSFNGTNCNHLARLNPGGRLDTNFNAAAGVDGVVSAAALQPDGNVLVAGNFITANGAVRPRIARLYGDSTLLLLSIARSSESTVVSWPAAFGHYQLQSNPNLSNSDDWSSVVAPRFTNNGFIFVTSPATNRHEFLRLSSP